MLFLSGAHPKRGARNVALFFCEVGSRSKRAKKNLARASCPATKSHPTPKPQSLQLSFEKQPQHQFFVPLFPFCKRLLQMKYSPENLDIIEYSVGCPRSSGNSACILAWRRKAGCNARLTADRGPRLDLGRVACSEQQPPVTQRERRRFRLPPSAATFFQLIFQVKNPILAVK